MKQIQSTENPIIKRAMSLKQRKGREEEGAYLIEGLNLCREGLGRADDMEVLLIRESSYSQGTDKELATIIELSRKKSVKAVLLEDKIFDRLMDTQTPQGLAAIMRCRFFDEDGFFEASNAVSPGNLLVLDRIQDPGNAGTLLRTAEAAGCGGIIALKGTVDLYSPKVVRAAAGSLFRLPLLLSEDPGEMVKLLHSRGKRVVVATPYCSSYYFRVPMDGDMAFVIGNEAGGVSKTFLDMSDIRIKIPMQNPVESLNAAVAGGILMYEAFRQNFHKEAEEENPSCKRS